MPQTSLIFYLYCGFLRNESLLFMHPPALANGAVCQWPTICSSFQVLLKENTEVLMIRQIDISVNWCKKSSKGILENVAEKIC